MNATVTLADGSVKKLSEFWAGDRLVLVFLRHFGWAFCREQVAQLRSRKADFDKADARVVLVGMGTPAECTAFLKKFDIPFPMIADPQQALYRQFHLKRLSVLGALSPMVAIKAVAAMARGSGIGRPVGDILQLPGVFVIDSSGRIVFSHQPASPADHAEPDLILKALSGAATG
jgi:peroxiredoxin